MTPQERFTAAAVILRDAIEKVDYERALQEAESQQTAMAS